MKYRAEIDGLRAIAIIPVILFHAGFDQFSGGFIGVDVFFVISGYLITTILIEDLENDRFSILRFYERRVRRVIPALFFVMSACIPFALFWMLPGQLEDFSLSLSAVSLFVSNILFWLESGYFESAAEEKPLLHTWSLAVEEQYYVFFPIFLYLAWRFGRNRAFWAIVTVAAISLALSEWSSRYQNKLNFYFAHTRVWELLAGSITAFIVVHRGARANNLLSLIGISAIVIAIFAFDRTTPIPSAYALAPVLGAVFLLLFANKQTFVAGILGSRILVGVGLISYSAYLWHQPLFAFARIYTLDQVSSALYIVLIAATGLLAFLSYRYVEQPFRKNSRISTKFMFGGTAIGMMMFTSLGIVGHYYAAEPPFVSARTKVLLDAISDWEYPGDLVRTDIPDYLKSDATQPIQVLFFGDSHAEQFGPIATDLAEISDLNVGFLTGGGCPPIPNLLDARHPACFDLFDRLQNVLESETELRSIFIAGCFNCYFIVQSEPAKNNTGNDYYFLLDGKKLYFRRSQGQPEAWASFGSFVRALTRDLKVVVVGDNPFDRNFDPRAHLNLAMRRREIFDREYPNFEDDAFSVDDRTKSVNTSLKLELIAPVSYIDTLSVVCPEDICDAFDDNRRPIYKDANHLRARFVRENFMPLFADHFR